MMKKLITLSLAIGAALSLQAQTFEMVNDCNPGSGDGNPSLFKEYQGKLVFGAAIGGGSSRVWITDGTTSGTEILPYSILHEVVVFDDNIFLMGNFGTDGNELWISDGTAAGTELFKDINVGNPLTPSSFPGDFVVSGGKLFFTATTTSNGREFWVTDGTAAGTEMIKDINVGTDDGVISALNRPVDPSVAFDDKLVFWAFDGTDQGLWISDGTDTGTTLLQSISTGSSFGMPPTFAELDGKLYFMATDGTNGLELWTTDGTPAGTEMVKDINPGSSHSTPFNFTVFDNKLYFTADNGSNSYELWQSDGTDSGTIMLKDINPGVEFSLPSYYAVYDGKLYFTASDSINGRELWVTDGTESGTVLFKDILPGTGDGLPALMTVYNGKLYFSATGSALGSCELWQSDGTSAGTIQIQPSSVTTTNPLDETYEFVVAGGALYFAANYNSSGRELWKLTDVPLPLTWLSFDATAIADHTASLNWKTAAETNLSHFEVERSNDGKNFKAIGKVQSAENPAEENEYQFIDDNVENNVVYYRLKQVDIDERFSYSAIAKVSFQADRLSNNLSIVPNPGRGFISLQIADFSNQESIKVVDMNGRLVFHAAVSGSAVNIPAAPGIYVVSLLDEAGAVLESKKAIVE